MNIIQLYLLFLLISISSGSSFVHFFNNNNNNNNKYNIYKYNIYNNYAIKSSTILIENNEISLKIFNLIKDFIKDESLISFISKTDLILILEELKSNEQLWNDNKVNFDKYWIKLDEELRNENRRIDEIIGSSLTTKIIKTVQDIDIYDPVAVRAFLQTPAIELMISGILYEGIFEFLQKVDIIGSIINNLPIIGPIRQTIVKEFKNSLDKLLGPQIKIFLSTFNRVAVERMISFVLSTDNRKGLQVANKKLIENLLSRPVSSLVPNRESSNKLKEQLWSAIKEIPIKDISNIIDILYEQVGDKSISSFIDVDKILDTSSTARNILNQNINRFISSEYGNSAINIIKNK